MVYGQSFSVEKFLIKNNHVIICLIFIWENQMHLKLWEFCQIMHVYPYYNNITFPVYCVQIRPQLVGRTARRVMNRPLTNNSYNKELNIFKCYTKSESCGSPCGRKGQSIDDKYGRLLLGSFSHCFQFSMSMNNSWTVEGISCSRSFRRCTAVYFV